MQTKAPAPKPVPRPPAEVPKKAPAPKAVPGAVLSDLDGEGVGVVKFQMRKKEMNEPDS